LAAKPMLVSLPLILLLMDFWPLGRRGLPRLLWEKLPLLLLVVVSSVVTFVVQSRGAAAKLENLSVGARMANALQSYLAYIGKMFWPTDLALLYPYRFDVPLWKTAAALVVLIGITAVAVWLARRRPYVLVGWLWYLISLVPVIGLVQVGVQGMADRYTYIPFVGLFVAIAWVLPKLPVVVPIAVVGILAVAARGQAELWQSSVGLWKHTVRVTVENPQAQINLANELLKSGQDLDAVAHFLEAVRLDPRFLDAHYNLGITLLRLGRTEEAANYFRQAIAIKPDYADAHNNLGFVMAVQRKPEEAERHYSEALRVNPEHVEAQSNIAVLLMQLGRTDEALSHFREALRLNPSSAKAHNNLAGALATQGRIDEAIQEYTEALRIDPGYADARNRLETLKRGGVE
jgi:tetratricopeptide (TPR) repeat protein